MHRAGLQASLVSPPAVEKAQQLLERRGLHVCRFVKIAAGALQGSVGSAEFNLSLAPPGGELDYVILARLLSRHRMISLVLRKAILNLWRRNNSTELFSCCSSCTLSTGPLQ